MSCSPNSVSVIAGCVNGAEPVSIHYEYTFDGNGQVSGLRRVLVTNARGNPLTIGPTDVVMPGCCPSATDLAESNFEWAHYNDTAVGGSCRKIILIASPDTPPVFSGFEMDTSPISAFDPNYIVEKCPCAGNNPTIVW